MRFTIISGVAAALLAAAPATAVTTVLDFNAAIACVGVCANYSQISQAYGDSAAVNVTYTSRTGIGNTAINGAVSYWGTDYSGLDQVAWSGTSDTSVTEIRFDVTPGNTFTLNSFDIGSYLNVSRSVTVSVFNLDYNLLTTYNLAVAGSPQSNGFVGFTTSTGYILQVGPDGYNGGISNLSFSTNAVPEPANWAMLIAGFGLVGATLRRRRAAFA